MALMGAPVDRDPELEDRMRNFQKEYLNFLTPDDRDDDTYAHKIGHLIQEGGSRLIVSLDDLRKHCPIRAKAILQTGFEEIIAFQRALKEVISNINPDFAQSIGEFTIGFEGSFGTRHVNPRSLKSHYIGQMVCCEGIVSKCSLVRPKVVRSVHYCPATGKTLERNYADLTSYDGFPTSASYPQEDENKNPLETEYGLSTYMDQQTLVIQEMPEMAPAGQMPRTVEIVAHDDMVDRCKPGDRIWAVGVYRALPSKHAGFTSGSFRTVLLANNIQLLSKDPEPNLHHGDVKMIRNVIKKEKNSFEMLAKSLAPSVHGHEFVKQAILCMLLGGLEKLLPNGTRLRGDINLLLIGDPSVAKSQMLRYVLQAAPRAVAATGRGSSGVGLTAAVTSDPDSGERRLEAGAMVMADRGIVCIDEFDKMTDTDRTAIHEVMEQGRVTIAKAGIHARLNARCSVLAAANPIRGSYDQTKDPMVNIGMQDSLLSRFDLIFILLDKHDEVLDSAIADHVLAIHRYRNPGEEDGAVLDLEGSLQTLTTLNFMAEQDKPTEIYEQAGSWIPSSSRHERFFTVGFMKKFIDLAKMIKPTLTSAATEYISIQYADLRQSEMQKSESERTTPVTARTLETMIRLATAHAKARLSTSVEEVDARKAYDLLYFACFKEAPKRILPKRKRKRDGAESEEENDLEETEVNGQVQVDDEVHINRGRKTAGELGKPDKKKDKPNSNDVYEFDMDDESDIHDFQTAKKSGTTIAQALSVDRYKAFQRYVRIVFDTRPSVGADQLPLQEVIDEVQKLAAESTARFSDGELKIAIEQLCSDNAAMISDDVMILI